jgi:hypothetical protein
MYSQHKASRWYTSDHHLVTVVTPWHEEFYSSVEKMTSKAFSQKLIACFTSNCTETTVSHLPAGRFFGGQKSCKTLYPTQPTGHVNGHGSKGGSPDLSPSYFQLFGPLHTHHDDKKL